MGYGEGNGNPISPQISQTTLLNFPFTLPMNNTSDTTGNTLFPVFFKLHQLDVLVVGGGYVGLEKLEAILKNSPAARVTLVAAEVLQPDIHRLAETHPHVQVVERAFRRRDLRDRDLVFLATNDRALHERIKKITRQRRIMTNVADTPDLCDFYLSSVVKKGDLKIAISSNGKSPTLTKRIREYLEMAIPDDVQTLLDNLKEVRDQLKGDFEYKVKKLNEVTADWLNSPTDDLADPSRLERTLAAFDVANQEDPRSEVDENGNEAPKELLYAQRMSRVLTEYAPNASEALRLATRCQHIRRWTVPRDSYPMDRKGYLRWRTYLKKFHGELAAEIMEAEGYDAATIGQVVDLLNKKNLKRDPEMQTLEDVICLVFLQFYFGDFLAQHSEEKVISVAAKTWGKMSEAGHAAASLITFSPDEMNLIDQATANPHN